MKQKNLYLLCGVPGSGKTTWCRKQISNPNYTCVYISRDEVRFSIIREDEEYFSHEDEVFDKFIDLINDALILDDVNVFVDATHLNEKARNKVLRCLDLNGVDIYPVNFNIPLETCLAQNELRKGQGRTYVPRGQIRRMAMSFVPASHNEMFTYKHILNIGGEID